MLARSAWRTAARPLQTTVRRYGSEAGGSGPGAGPFFFLAGGAALAGVGYWYLTGTSAVDKAEAKLGQRFGGSAKKAFTGGDQDFVSLRLADVETVNDNTKRFRFELPEGDMTSGLHVASAILTKYKGPEDEKPTVRPYTPISDEGMHHSSSAACILPWKWESC